MLVQVEARRIFVYCLKFWSHEDAAAHSATRIVAWGSDKLGSSRKRRGFPDRLRSFPKRENGDGDDGDGDHGDAGAGDAGGGRVTMVTVVW